MFQVRVHGRGGQGVVTGAEMLSIAAFLEGKHAQAFPSFGSERTGAPVVAFCRIDTKEIRLREPIMAPDAIIIQDPTLLNQVDVFQGLKPDGWVLINSKRDIAALGLGDIAGRLPPGHVATVPASEIAQARLGRAQFVGQLEGEVEVAVVHRPQLDRERCPRQFGRDRGKAGHAEDHGNSCLLREGTARRRRRIM